MEEEPVVENPIFEMEVEPVVEPVVEMEVEPVIEPVIEPLEEIYKVPNLSTFGLLNGKYLIRY